MRVLMNEVASKTNKLDAIAINLDITTVDLERIARECNFDISQRFLRVFDLWRRRGSPPFTLNTIVSALHSESVGEFQLAKNLQEKYSIS